MSSPKPNPDPSLDVNALNHAMWKSFEDVTVHQFIPYLLIFIGVMLFITRVLPIIMGRDEHSIESRTPKAPPPQPADPDKLAATRRRLDVVEDEWLDYDRDVSLLVTRPAMRNYALAPTSAAPEAIQRARRVGKNVTTAPDLTRFTEAVSDAEIALREAVLFADGEAQRDMSERERSVLERAQRALAIALDGGATTAERHSAYRVVERLMRELGTPVPEQASTTIRAQIEPATVPVGELTSSLIVRTPEVIIDGLPQSGPSRRVYVTSRVARAGESEIHALTEITRDGATTATFDAGDRQATERLRESLSEQKTMLVGLSTCDEPDVAEAAKIRLADVNDALDITRNLTGEPA